VISFKWFQLWKEYCGYDDSFAREEAKPGFIDNSDLIEKVHQDKDNKEFIELKQGLQRGYDYEIVPYVVWNMLSTWYTGGPVIERTVIAVGSFTIVEIYPIRIVLTIQITNPPSTITTLMSFRRIQRLTEIRSTIGRLLQTPPHSFKVFLTKVNELEELTTAQLRCSFEELEIVDGQKILLIQEARKRVERTTKYEEISIS